MIFQSVQKQEVYFVETSETDYMRDSGGQWYNDMPLDNSPVTDMKLLKELEDTFQKWMR
jgi:hypothetical protein